MATTTLTEALVLLQEATDKLVAAHKALAEHNIDLDAHDDIRQAIKEITESESIYTRREIIELCTKTVEEHHQVPIDKAHPGFDTYKEETENVLANLAGRLQSLETWRDTGIMTEAKTDLQKALEEVESKYAVILASLQEALMEAQGNGNDELVEEIKESIAKALAEKNTELLQVITNWQNEHSKPTE